MHTMSTGTWASVDERCPLRCKLDSGDSATVIIGDDNQSVELTFNAARLLRLVEVSRQAVAEMGALDRQEAATQVTCQQPALSTVSGAPC